MSFESFIASRHLTRRMWTTVISVISLALGVAALIVVPAVFTGFHKKLKSTIVGVHPHIKIEKWGGMDNLEDEIARVRAAHVPGMRTVAGFILEQGILRSEATATGTYLNGVDTKHEDLSIFQKSILAGEFDLSDRIAEETKRGFLFFKKTVRTSVPSIVIGEELAYSLHVRVGDLITVIVPSFEGSESSFSLLKTESRQFVLRGIFHLGVSDLDSSYALIELSQAQALYHLGSRVSGLGIHLSDVDQALHSKESLQGDYGPGYVISSWQDFNPSLFQAIRVERSVQRIFMAMIILVAAFNIFSNLFIIVMSKTKDIGILRVLGATTGSIRRIFLLQGFTVGFFGVVFGIVSGLTLLFYRNEVLDFIKQTTGVELFPSDVYLFDGLPAEIGAREIALVACFALASAMLAAIHPANRAARLTPVEALRYE